MSFASTTGAPFVRYDVLREHDRRAEKRRGEKRERGAEIHAR